MVLTGRLLEGYHAHPVRCDSAFNSHLDPKSSHRLRECNERATSFFYAKALLEDLTSALAACY